MIRKFNDWLATKVTNAVGTMLCAYIFAGIALLGLPAALRPNGEGIVAWIAQTFLQLVLLSVILVGQRLQSEKIDAHHERVHARLDAAGVPEDKRPQ